MNIYPQTLEREPENTRGKSATVLYENGSLSRLVEYAPNGEINALSLFEFEQGSRGKIPQKKLVFGGRIPADLVRAGVGLVTVLSKGFSVHL